MFIVVGASGNKDVVFNTFECRNHRNKVPVFATREAAIRYGNHSFQQMIARMVEFNVKPNIKENDFTVTTHEQDPYLLIMTDGYSTWELRIVEFDLPTNDYEIHRTGFQNYALWCKGNPINITSSLVVVEHWKKQFNVL